MEGKCFMCIGPDMDARILFPQYKKTKLVFKIFFPSLEKVLNYRYTSFYARDTSLNLWLMPPNLRVYKEVKVSWTRTLLETRDFVSIWTLSGYFL